ncbi:ArnT family glycosyltransferase [Lacticaseibacillus zhaodongensis]|uniref:ArnT family glycosyltransferase n=1 Tax=Lacticaseibacillus zhaodongensis TaxID=2668065 RepID=UPI0012D3005C|nr:glycosyltransferase family 39 protein [Lacticaseibacillus zhaodongensis]
MHIFRKILNGFLLLLGLVTTVIILVDTIKAVHNTVMTWAAIAAILLFVVIAILLTLTPRRRGWRIGILSVILIVAFALRATWILHTRSFPVADFYTFYEASIDFAHGVNPFHHPGYFATWPYQNGFVIWQSWLMRIFGTSELTLQMVNAAFSTLTVLVIYFLGKELMNFRTGLLAAYVYALYVPAIVMSSVLTNQTVATLFYLCGFWLLLRSQKNLAGSWRWLWGSAGAGFLLACGNILRPLGSLIMLAIGVFYVCYMLWAQRGHWRDVLKPLAFVAVLFGLYFGTMGAANTAIVATGTAPYKLVNRNPTWKFVTGLDYDSNGMYSNMKIRELGTYALGHDRNVHGKWMIQQETKDKGKILHLFWNKARYMWSHLDDAYNWAVNNDSAAINPNNRGQKLATTQAFQGMQWFTIFLAFAAGLLAIFTRWGKRLQISYMAPMFVIMWFGYAAVHLLIEIQLRYRFFIMPTIIIIGAMGAVATCQWAYRKLLPNDPLQLRLDDEK